MTELRKYYEKSEEISPDDELVKRTKKYMETHPEVDYSTASDAVLTADPELARAYVMEDLRGYESPDPEKNFIPAEPSKKTGYQLGLDASAEIARLSEIEMLERDLTYEKAQMLVFKRSPALLRQYTHEILAEE